METPADAMREAMGVGRASLRWWRISALLSTAGMIGLGGWLAWEIKTEPTVLPFVLVLDEETRVLDTIQARAWEPNAAVYADVARRWIQNIRNRSPNDLITRAMRTEAQKLTDKRLYRQVEQMLVESDETLRKDEGIEVHAIVKMRPGSISDDGSSIVALDWKERKYKVGGGAGPWVDMYANVHVARIPASETGELEANPLGLYVSAFTFAGAGPTDVSMLHPADEEDRS